MELSELQYKQIIKDIRILKKRCQKLKTKYKKVRHENELLKQRLDDIEKELTSCERSGSFCDDGFYCCL